MPKSEVFNADCLPAMRQYPDNAFTLCVADPPYGINVTGRQRERERERSSSEAQAGRSVVRVYGESRKALATQNFIPCSMMSPHRTRRLSGRCNESVRR